VFNFPYLSCAWDAARLRQVIDATLALHAPVGAPPTWVLSNHDVDRIVSRYGRADTSFMLELYRRALRVCRAASGPLDGGRRPADTAVWLRIQGG
jgi:glycosidase